MLSCYLYHDARPGLPPGRFISANIERGPIFCPHGSDGPLPLFGVPSL